MFGDERGNAKEVRLLLLRLHDSGFRDKENGNARAHVQPSHHQFVEIPQKMSLYTEKVNSGLMTFDIQSRQNSPCVTFTIWQRSSFLRQHSR